ncbi:MAG: hypothetical protein VYC86_01200, partial [Pseudomonadota bacterium]|nr:hypothetical protein [Pseudomonadota bacterium]
SNHVAFAYAVLFTTTLKDCKHLIYPRKSVARYASTSPQRAKLYYNEFRQGREFKPYKTARNLTDK